MQTRTLAAMHPTFARTSLAVLISRLPAAGEAGTVPTPKYCVGKGGLVPCQPCYAPDRAEFSATIDEPNGFVQIDDFCPTALHSGHRTQMAIFTPAESDPLVLVSTWMLSGAYGHAYDLRAFDLVSGALVSTSLKKILPELSAETFLAENYDVRELARIRRGFTRSDLGDKNTLHYSNPFFAYTLPRLGTDVTVDVDMAIFSRGNDPNLGKIQKLQETFLRSRKYLLNLVWDPKSRTFSIGPRIPRRTDHPGAVPGHY